MRASNKSKIRIKHESKAPDCVWLFRYEHEQPFRKAVEEEISSLYKVIDNASFTRTELENQVERMSAELLNLSKTHEEVSIQTVHVSITDLQQDFSLVFQLVQVLIWKTCGLESLWKCN